MQAWASDPAPFALCALSRFDQDFLHERPHHAHRQSLEHEILARGIDLDRFSFDFDLTFAGTGYNPHDGQDVWFMLQEAGTYVDVGTVRTTATDGAGNINEVWTGVLEPGKTYALFWAADLSGDGTCTPPPGDHGWSVAIPAVSGDVTINETHNTSFDPGVCDHL